MPISFAEKIKVKWAKNTSRAADNYEHFIELVDVNPMELAAAQNEKRHAKLEAIKDIWPEIMKKIPFENWKKMVKEIGVDAFRKNVPLKAFKMEAFAEGWEKVYKPHLDKIRALPAVTDAQREKRMLENRKVLISLKGKWR